AAFTGVSDSEIETQVFDYSQPTRAREPLRAVSYAELRGGRITIGDKKVHTAPISSYKVARSIAETLKGWISEGRFLVSAPVEPLPSEGGMNVLDKREEEV
ncbi:MAG: homocysteine biosynthesis protein, partial [Actinobacteria bacterium]|nr:homocysteine biosynthesis protein [Actinomycetota bacterium]